MTVIGESVPRLEDRALLTGTGRFAGDKNFEGQLHMRVVRAPVAHGRILSIMTEDAAAMPGVFAIWTGADVADVPPIDLRPGSALQDLEKCRQHILAQEIVRYVGEPLAVVFADDPYRAEDGAELVWAEIEELPPVVGLMDALGEFAPGISTEPAVFKKGYGDVDAAFAGAAHVIECELSVGRHAGVPLETRGALAVWNEAEDRLEFHAAAKIPHTNRIALADLLGLELEQLHLFEGHVGGSFGVRGELYPDEVLVNLAAMRFRRPVKWIEDRMEHLIAANHSREQTHRIRAATDAEGLILGLDDAFWFNQGAYARTHGATVPLVSATMLPGPYKIPAYRTTGHIRLTNVTPAGTYRGPGRFETTFVREQLMDRIAAELKLDPLAVRRTNLITSDEMPYERPFEIGGKPIFYDSGDYPRSLARLLDHVGYDALQVEMVARRAAGEMAGAAVICFVELGGDGPFDDVRVEMDAGGTVEIITGVASVGQGVETVIAQICAETLGMDYAGIAVTHGQTDRIARGQGARASRVTVMTGNATHKAAMGVRAMLLEEAAQLLQSPVKTLDIVDGVIGVSGRSGDGASLTIAEAAAEILRHRDASRISVEETFENDRATYSFGAQLATVRVDPLTAGVTVERFVVAYDIGRAVNPMLVEGQLVGGAVQGIGGALFEEFLYDENGQPLSVTFADYLMPTAAEVPDVECLVLEDSPSTTNPLALKSGGDPGVTGAGAAIASAIGAALGQPGAITRLPVSPLRLREILRKLSP
ncbi:MAG: xanthine dehydrogenase family protein molybdopterin-binding subunit [Alphaproteobacteria bacterium]|nr:xanthine dehydrogenase family protein molybdopterin-binding subunit [Alphaproteobacteria bacterium]